MTDESLHRWIVDSIEEEAAAIEMDGARIMIIPLALLPAGTNEGDVFRVVHARGAARSSLMIERDEEARELLLQRSRKQASAQVGKGGEGNIRL